MTTSDLLGGEAALGRPVRTTVDLIHAVRDGLPTAAVDELLQSGRLSLAEIDAAVVPRRTLSHRRRVGRLTPEQSDRLARVAGAIALAEETFGSREKAGVWLRRPTEALGGDAPIGLLDTAEGIAAVERLLLKIAHGIAA